ncbi:PAP2-domain-containing protein [Tilletiaria anomala UBC 951]|uniref:PAP2-domain-containing protein n=1 Tax=Tilletiaria anomala (strain ATCC 24038 / CBS 436.72 / UBC 951) TaxID=1037660 RepID=A0A066VSE9_TILAU|nr:PAP2-domain-containing protein [Tilletiaria anomala UBC 951]KDN44361.1 PAP2-domain-containing protein [Tilletiaria anomala UBC 951]
MQRQRCRRRAGAPPRPELPLGLWLLKHTQRIVAATAAGALVHLRCSSHSVYYLTAALATALLAKALKQLIRQPRPQHANTCQPPTHGMPSTHSATITFMGLYLVLGARGTIPAAATALGLLLPPAVMWSRVHLGLHTPTQTLAGAALGASTAAAAFLLWHGGGSAYTTGVRDAVVRRVDPLVRSVHARAGRGHAHAL